MIQNIQEEQQNTEGKSLVELQAIFEEAINNGAMYDHMDLQADMSFKYKSKDGNYMCCATLAVFKMFLVGYSAGLQSTKE